MAIFGERQCDRCNGTGKWQNPNQAADKRDCFACNGLSEHTLQRSHMESWIKSLSEAGLAPSTRHNYIRKVLHYFHWRHDRGEFHIEPARLLSVSDLPKRPKLLPKPFPLAVDLEIQRRLRDSDQLLHKAILLLRRTGVRTQELWLLPELCVHEDHAGNSFLKVPLGKMKSERLVPLDRETLTLITAIGDQSRGMRGAASPNPDHSGRLVYGPAKNWSFYQNLRAAFLSITSGLSSTEPMGLHRLRHTYATELLSAGMSLYGVMQLLGHRCITTTLVYAGIVQQTIHEEYHAAQIKLKDRYEAIRPMGGNDLAAPISPALLADDLARVLRSRRASAGPTARVKIQRLIKRVDHLRVELKSVQ